MDAARKIAERAGTQLRVAELENRILSFMAEDTGHSIEQLRASIAQDYAQAGKTLDTDGAARELVATFCESKLFTDEKSVRRLL